MCLLEGATGTTGEGGLVLLDAVALAATLVLLHGDVDSHGLVVQFAAVLRARHAHSATDGTQRALRDVHGRGVGVLQVQAVPHLAAFHLAFQHLEHQLQVAAGAGLGGFFLTAGDDGDVVAFGQGGEFLLFRDGRCVKSIESHNYSLRWFLNR